MAVQLDPASQLSFERPLTRLSTEVLLVGNPNNGPVMFKIKTTAPKQYCVRPNAGRIEPHSQIEVQVILQPFSQEPPVDHKCKDKFLIQTAIIKPVYEALSLAEMWAITEAEDRESIFQQKIKCTFRPPTTTTSVTPSSPLQQQAQEHVDQKALPPIPNEISTQEPMMNHEEHQAAVAAVATEADTASSSSTESVVEEKPSRQEQQAKSETSSQEDINTKELSSPTNKDSEQRAHGLDDEVISQQRQQQPDTTSQQQVMNTTTKATMMDDEDADKSRLKQELRQALELVEHLKNQIANMEHERKMEQEPAEKPQFAGAWEKPAGNMSVEEGYPPQMVMTIASLVFVFTYLFF